MEQDTTLWRETSETFSLIQLSQSKFLFLEQGMKKIGHVGAIARYMMHIFSFLLFPISKEFKSLAQAAKTEFRFL